MGTHSHIGDVVADTGSQFLQGRVPDIVPSFGGSIEDLTGAELDSRLQQQRQHQQEIEDWHQNRRPQWMRDVTDFMEPVRPVMDILSQAHPATMMGQGSLHAAAGPFGFTGEMPSRPTGPFGSGIEVPVETTAVPMATRPARPARPTLSTSLPEPPAAAPGLLGRLRGIVGRHPWKSGLGALGGLGIGGYMLFGPRGETPEQKAARLAEEERRRAQSQSQGIGDQLRRETEAARPAADAALRDYTEQQAPQRAAEDAGYRQRMREMENARRRMARPQRPPLGENEVYP